MSSMQTEDRVTDLSVATRHNAGSTGTVPSSTFNLPEAASLLVDNSNDPTIAESLLVNSSRDRGGLLPNPEGREDFVVGLEFVPDSPESPDDDLQQEVVVAPIALTAQSEPNHGADEIVVVGLFAPNSIDDNLQQEIALTGGVREQSGPNNGLDEIVVVGLNAPNRGDDDLQEEIALTERSEPIIGADEIVVVGLNAPNSADGDLQQEIALAERSEPINGADDIVVLGLNAPNSTDENLQQEVDVTERSEPINGADDIVLVGLNAPNSTDENLQQEIAVTERSERVNGADAIVVVGQNAPNSTVENLEQEIAVTERREPNNGADEIVVVGLYAPNSTDENRQQEVALTGETTQANAGNARILVGLHGQNTSAERFQRDEPVGFGVEAAAGQGGSNPGGGASAVVGRNTPNGGPEDLQPEPALVPVQVVPQVEPNLGVETVVLELSARNRADGFQSGLSSPAEIQKRSFEEVAKQLGTGNLSQEQNGNDGDSLVCPICMEPWTNSGEHRICSLACGHLFGKSCIKRWMRQCGKKSSRCPHCNKRTKLEDLRTLYVPRTLAVVDGEAQQLVQELRALRDENSRLKLENEKMLQEIRWNKGKAGHVNAPAVKSLMDHSATNQLINMNEPMNITSRSEPLQDLGNKMMSSAESARFGLYRGSDFRSKYYSAVASSGREDHQHIEGGSNEAGPHSSSSRGGQFQLRNEVRIHGGKVFDMDAESLTVLFSNKIDGSGNSAGLSKMSLLSCSDIDKIHLPSGLGAIRDIRISPPGMGGTSKCALVASTGRKLSLFSLESNNVVLTYSVQSPPWSCVWDPYVPNIFYSGLQNGALHMVDLRQTSSPVAVLGGPVIRPLHSLQVVQDQSCKQQANMGSHPFGRREILSASNSGISLWHLDLNSLSAGSEPAKPHSVFSDKEMLCISLAYESSINTAVASFRRYPPAQTQSSSSFNPGQTSSQQHLEGPSNRRPSTIANSYDEPSHWIFSRGQDSWSQLNERIRAAEFRLPHENIFGEMAGNRSEILMPRTAIIPQSKSAPRCASLFACGDEVTNSLWLWNMTSCSLIDTLAPHPSPVLDVKNVQILGTDTLGCLSEGALQIYRRLPMPE